jgi:hypothetical protein
MGLLCGLVYLGNVLSDALRDAGEFHVSVCFNLCDADGSVGNLFGLDYLGDRLGNSFLAEVNVTCRAMAHAAFLANGE